MKTETATVQLGALAHQTRLEIFRLLVRAGPEGMTAGDIGRGVGGPLSTASSHLNVLFRAGLLKVEPRSKERLYSVDYAAMSGLLAYLAADCCAGNPAICAPLADIPALCGADNPCPGATQ